MIEVVTVLVLLPSEHFFLHFVSKLLDPQNVLTGVDMGVSKNRGKTPKMDGL